MENCKCDSKWLILALYFAVVGVVIIDDHPEVTTVEDSQCNTVDDGFTEVVSKKQQKRLQDEERRKKEEQVVQVIDRISIQLQ